MARISIDIDQTHETVDSSFFGGNFLFDRDDVTNGGTFDEKVDGLGVTYLRYPGGTIAEKFFHLDDPDRTVAPEHNRSSITPLSDFTAYAGGKAIDYALVAPTLTYIRAIHAGEMTLAEASAELRIFLVELKNGVYGDHMPATIEIGNEYYAERVLTGVPLADAYGALARSFAETIQDVFGDEVEIAVQAGRRTDRNDAILNHFLDAEGLVDQVIIHSYPWQINHFGFHHGFRVDLANKWLNTGAAETIFLSEWNVSNQFLDTDGVEIDTARIERGMAQSVGILELAYGFIAAGVTSAAVWPLQQNTPGDLGGDEGELGGRRKFSEDGLTLAGETFKLMSESIIGLSILEVENVDLDGVEEDARYREELYLQAYADQSQVVVFASSWDLQPDQVGAELSFDLPGHFVSATVTRLTTNADDPLDPNGGPVIEETVISPLANSADVTLTFTEAYEIFRIVYERLPGEFLVGTADADMRIGGDESDRILGRNGDDTLNGGAGRDTILGQGASDEILAGRGDDLIIGGRGDDRLIGGRGDDEQRGGAGVDVLRGGGGADTLKAGRDDDFLSGGRGADSLLGGAGDDVLRGGAGGDVLIGGGADDLMMGDAGRDRLIAGPGDDTLTGGDGADKFVFVVAASNHVVTDYDDGRDQIFVENGDADLAAVAFVGDGAVLSVGEMEVLFANLAPGVLTLEDVVFL